MTWINRCLPLTALLLAAAPLSSQEVAVRAQLEARGLAPTLIAEVAAIAADATAQGIPTGPLANKAIEGWAKRVPEARIMMAVRQMSAQMIQAQTALRAAGLDGPPGMLIAAAAEALGRGMRPEDVRTLLDAVPAPDQAGDGLRVAAALAAQGLGREQAVAVVVRALRRGEPAARLLDLPSIAQALKAQGLGPAQIGKQMMEGGGMMGSRGQGQGAGGRPPGVPPGRPDNPPGQSKRPSGT
jgi:hypothetical protein